jgi:N-6 DNA Methylase
MVVPGPAARPVVVSERTLYPKLEKFIQGLGVVVSSEIGAEEGRGWTDLVCDVDEVRVIVEIRFGGPKDRTQLIIDAQRHAREERAFDFAILLYPELVNKHVLPDQIESLALDTKVLVTPATRWWSENVEGTVEARDFLTQLFSPAKRAAVTIDFASLVSRLQSRIESLSISLRRAIRTNGRASFAQVVGRFESFVTLSGIDPDDKKAVQQVRIAAIDLIAFLLVNQLIFYRVYQTRKPSSGLPDLPQPLTSIGELSEGFDKIAAINYDPIFGIDLVSAMEDLTDTKFLTEDVAALVGILPVLRPEQISHDLVGRLFHDLLPFATRKTLGAFFTKPVAAEVLATVAIRPRHGKLGRTIIDPACGSGTLLVAAYRAFEKCESPKDVDAFHKEFIEDRLTGVDVMPFAASLTATNLAAQNVATTLVGARVGMADSLGIEQGATIPAFSTAMQVMLEGLGIAPKTGAKAKGRKAVALRKRGHPFNIEPVDYVIMNPPFSDWEKIPDDIKRGIMARSSLVTRAGGTANLWQLFVIRAWDLGHEGTVHAAVLPINLFRGRATEKVRQHLYEHATIEAVIVSEKEIAFSESAQYRDVLAIYRQEPPSDGHEVRVVHLHRSLELAGLDGATTLGEALGKAIYEEGDPPEDCWIERVAQPTSVKGDKLAARVFGSGTPERQRLERSLERIYRHGKSKLRPVRASEIWEGFGPRPKGLSEIVLVRRDTPGMRAPTHRTRQAALILTRATGNRLEFYRKGPSGEKLLRLSATVGRKGLLSDEEKGVLPALTTMAGVRTLDLAEDTDFVLTAPYPSWQKARNLSTWSERKDRSQMFSWKELVVNNVRGCRTQLAVPDKLQLDSPDAFLLATYREEPFVITNMLYGITTTNSGDAALQALWLNSIFTIAFFALRQSGALAGGLTRLKISDWVQHRLLDVEKLTDEDRKLLGAVFKELRRLPMKNFTDQLSGDPHRVKIDSALLQVLGFTEREARELLPDIYSAVKAELSRASERLGTDEEDTGQRTLDEADGDAE